jgi:hypothetical protein
MPRVDCLKATPITRTIRVRQIEGMFDVAPSERSECRWSATLPLEEKPWSIGAIVGPSGSGKSTLARELFGADVIEGFAWLRDASLLDGFPTALGIKEIVALLSSVGFSSPPAWLRPFHVLSTGEQFRVTLARALAESRELVVIDEFTSVVDRTVAQIGSAAVAKAVRGSERKLIAVSCHYDILDWLDPDWTYEPATDRFQWRCLQRRPPIELTVLRVGPAAWHLFRPHHYLSSQLSPSAKCFVAFLGQRPAAFTAVIHRPDSKGGYWSEHRTVCRPDFQGVGIGNALSELVASFFVATGKRYCSRTSHPAMMRHRAKSPNWRLTSRPKFASGPHSKKFARLNKSAALTRYTAGFRYVGPAHEQEAALRMIACFRRAKSGVINLRRRTPDPALQTRIDR